MLRLWSYEDCSCGESHQSIPISAKKIPKTIKCSCGKRMGWAAKRTNGIHATHSGLYGRYEPGLGWVVDSYGHKQQLMRDMDVIEASDPVGGSRCHQKEEPQKMSQNNSTWMDEADLAKAQKEAIDRAARGDFDVTF